MSIFDMTEEELIKAIDIRRKNEPINYTQFEKKFVRLFVEKEEICKFDIEDKVIYIIENKWKEKPLLYMKNFIIDNINISNSYNINHIVSVEELESVIKRIPQLKIISEEEYYHLDLLKYEEKASIYISTKDFVEIIGREPKDMNELKEFVKIFTNELEQYKNDQLLSIRMKNIFNRNYSRKQKRQKTVGLSWG